MNDDKLPNYAELLKGIRRTPKRLIYADSVLREHGADVDMETGEVSWPTSD